ncbi:MAG: cupin domain-containing protein [Pseudomonadota bacterium]
MAETASNAGNAAVLLDQCLVRYNELRPCTTAFIDTRTPGSAEKENFTIIGPGVAENPDRHVHISVPHGFNIGGARQPPNCVNSQHSHETAEVFMIHSGTWAFYLGPNREDGEVVLRQGDIISIPVHVFRGFKNVGEEPGFMFAVLGGDDPGHVTWAPYVFEYAAKYGLVLLDDGSLVDTTRGERVPADKQPMRPTTEADVERLRRMSAAELAECIVTAPELDADEAAMTAAGLRESAVIGSANPDEGIAAGKMHWPHGFHLRHIAAQSGVATRRHRRQEREVILMHRGLLTVEFDKQRVTLGPGDTLTIPIGLPRSFSNESPETAEAWVVRGSDRPKPAALLS